MTCVAALSGNDLSLRAGLPHRGSNHEMGEQQRVDFLNHPLGGQTPQGACRQAQMRASLIYHDFHPALARDRAPPDLWLGTPLGPIRSSPAGTLLVGSWNGGLCTRLLDHPPI